MNRSAVLLALGLTVAAVQPGTWAGVVDYDIVYVRAPRYGDLTDTRWQEVLDPVRLEPGQDLMLLHPDGTEELLVPAGDGSIVDPALSFDGQWVYYAKFHDLRPATISSGPRYGGAPTRGADIFKIHLPTRQIVQLTRGEWTPNTGVADWSSDPLKAVPAGTKIAGYMPFNLGPCPVPGGKVVFTSSRNTFQVHGGGQTFPNMQLFIMDEDGNNVQQIGHLNLGSALHPTVLMDGRVMFSSYESFGLRDGRLWGLWAIRPDGRHWESLMGAFVKTKALHFQTQLSNGDIATMLYYYLGSNSFGTILAFPALRSSAIPPFGSPVTKDPSNPLVKILLDGEQISSTQFNFSPPGLYHLTPFSTGDGSSTAKRDANGVYMGKVTHPSGAPNNEVLLVWSPGPCQNYLRRPPNVPREDGGLYLLKGGTPVNHPRDLVLIKNDPNYNEQQPKAVVPYTAIYGLDEPMTLESAAEEAGARNLPAGSPFALVGTSSFYKRNSAPGSGSKYFKGGNGESLDGLFGAGDTSNWNWLLQGADAGKYTSSDIYAVRVLAVEATTNKDKTQAFHNYGNARLRILGEIPLRKYDGQSQPILDVDGNPDTSFLAKIPADVPFTFQTIDKDGMVLNMAQTFYHVRPGEARFDCGGCHAMDQLPTRFETTEANQPSYQIRNLALATPLLSKNTQGAPVVIEQLVGAVDVEYYRDIKPILQRSCVGCHSAENSDQESIKRLVLDDTVLTNVNDIGLYENTYHRLANDEDGQYGIPSVNGSWGGRNASRYIRKFQSRRSLLIWKLFGRRLDGWTNEEHPTETVPGDPATIPIDPISQKPFVISALDLDYTGTIMPPPNSGYPPLSEDEKMLFVRWVDLGAPISQNPPSLEKRPGWFLDETRPTLTVATPSAGLNETSLRDIRFGMFDYYSGLDRSSLSVKADFPVNGQPAGAELAPLFEETGDHIWTMALSPLITELAQGTLTVRIKDQQGNEQQVVRRFAVQADELGIPGDLDRDGRITLIDLRQLIEMLIGARSVDLATADLNADNQLSLADLRELITLLIRQ